MKKWKSQQLWDDRWFWDHYHEAWRTYHHWCCRPSGSYWIRWSFPLECGSMSWCSSRGHRRRTGPTRPKLICRKCPCLCGRTQRACSRHRCHCSWLTRSGTPCTEWSMMTAGDQSGADLWSSSKSVLKRFSFIVGYSQSWTLGRMDSTDIITHRIRLNDMKNLCRWQPWGWE